MTAERIERRLAKLESQSGTYTHEEFTRAYRLALDTGLLPEPGPMRDLIERLIDSLAAIERVQEGITPEEAEQWVEVDK